MARAIVKGVFVWESAICRGNRKREIVIGRKGNGKFGKFCVCNVKALKGLYMKRGESLEIFDFSHSPQSLPDHLLRVRTNLRNCT